MALVSCGKNDPDGGFTVGLNNVDGNGTFYAVELENRVLAKFTVTQIKLSSDMKSVLEIYGVGYEMVSAPGPTTRTSEGLRFSFNLDENDGKYYLPGEDYLIFRNVPDFKISGDKVSLKWNVMAVTGAPRLIEFEASLKK